MSAVPDLRYTAQGGGRAGCCRCLGAGSAQLCQPRLLLCWLCVSNSSSSPKTRELEPLFQAGASGLRDSSAGSSTLFQPALLAWAGSQALGTPAPLCGKPEQTQPLQAGFSKDGAFSLLCAPTGLVGKLSVSVGEGYTGVTHLPSLRGDSVICPPLTSASEAAEKASIWE